MDGYELARRMRAHPLTRDTRLIALSGYGQSSDKELSARAGFDAHLVKPIAFGGPPERDPAALRAGPLQRPTRVR